MVRSGVKNDILIIIDWPKISEFCWIYSDKNKKPNLRTPKSGKRWFSVFGPTYFFDAKQIASDDAMDESANCPDSEMVHFTKYIWC